MSTEISQEERLLGALAYASLIASGMGIVAGILIYVTQKEKSAWLGSQALQAVLYQLAGLFLIIVLWSCWGVFYMLTLIPLIAIPEKYGDQPPAIFWVGMGSMICPFLIMGVWGLYGLYGAIRAWMGADFRYAIIGRLAENRMAA